MQPTYPMDDTQWSKLIQNVAYYFDDLTLKRGSNIINKIECSRLP